MAIKKLKKLNSRKKFDLITYIKKPVNFSLLTFIILIVLTVGALYVFRDKTNSFITPINDKIVIINYDHKILTIPSKEPTVGALLKKLNIVLNQGDVVEPSLSTPIFQDDFRINIYRAKPVEIIDGSNISFVFSAAVTPRAIVEQQGIKLYSADLVSDKPVSNFLSSYSIGRQITILPATPVYVNLYGTSLLIRTQAKTVEQLIKQEDIHLSKSDQIIPQLSSSITPYSQVFIVRHGVKIESITNQLPMPIQYISDSSLAYGTGAIRQVGSPGQEVITYQDNLSNGVVTGRTVLQDVITEQPVTQIEVEGTSLSGIKGDMALAGISPNDYQYADYIISHESGWCPTKWQGEIGYCPSLFQPIYSVYDGYEGYGLCQSTPAAKMSSAGSDWEINPVTQLKWCSSYAQSKYNGWYNAYEHWINYHNW